LSQSTQPAIESHQSTHQAEIIIFVLVGWFSERDNCQFWCNFVAIKGFWALSKVCHGLIGFNLPCQAVRKPIESHLVERLKSPWPSPRTNWVWLKDLDFLWVTNCKENVSNNQFWRVAIFEQKSLTVKWEALWPRPASCPSASLE
jgi:hypothetical protein